LFFSVGFAQTNSFNDEVSGIGSGTLLLTASNVSEISEIDRKVDSLLSILTLEEKIRQMNQYIGFWNVTGPVPANGDAAKNTITCEKDG